MIVQNATVVAMPWDLAPHLPWQVFTSPVSKWATQPSFVVGEYLFMLCALLALFHARAGGRKYVMAWLGALVAGTANDLIFMAMPVVDNFWQAQSTVMLTPRLPLYIPCVYVCFMYYPTVAVWRLGLRPVAAAMATGVVAMVFYGPYDIVGAKFLWWTWHDTDRPIEQRLLGAPIGSSMWVLTFVASFAYLLARVVARDPGVSRGSMLRGIGLVAGLSSLMMVVQITALQQLDHGVPGPLGLIVAIAVYGAVVAHGWSRRVAATGNPRDRVLHVVVVGYFVVLVAIGALFDPATHVSTSMHQPHGQCYVEAKDIAGFTRYEFLCVQDFDEDFTFGCVDQPLVAGEQWYTVCGRGHRNFTAWMLGVGGLAALGIALFSLLLRRSSTARSS